VEFGLVYELWEIFLFERDKYLIFYLAVGLLKTKRTEILGFNSMEKLIKYLSTECKIYDFSQLAHAYQISLLIRSHTPLSFPILVNKLGLFDPNIIISNEELEMMEGFNMTSQYMSIYTRELI
jgi:hypothetical protein